MQFDFHYGVTYLVARFAGFDPHDAEVIAHSAQYVDDATKEGEIWFDNGMIFRRLASAHKMLDYANTNALADRRVWLPFHFFPGNKGEPRPEKPPTGLTREEFYRRCICVPNSHPVRDLMEMAVRRSDAPYALHQLGIAAHVFVDTWAHQDFVGYPHKANKARNVKANDGHHPQTLTEKLVDFYKLKKAETLSEFVGLALPLGHGSVLSYPDLPYLVWSYTNGEDVEINRNNHGDFYEAACRLYGWFVRYREFVETGVLELQSERVPPAGFEKIGDGLRDFQNPDAAMRFANWCELVRSGVLGKPEEIPAYVEKGTGSWKAIALGTVEDVDQTEHKPLPMETNFVTSDWKRFHDALLSHRFFVLHELLPAYGLLSA